MCSSGKRRRRARYCWKRPGGMPPKGTTATRTLRCAAKLLCAGAGSSAGGGVVAAPSSEAAMVRCVRWAGADGSSGRKKEVGDAPRSSSVCVQFRRRRGGAMQRDATRRSRPIACGRFGCIVVNVSPQSDDARFALDRSFLGLETTGMHRRKRTKQGPLRHGPTCLLSRSGLCAVRNRLVIPESVIFSPPGLSIDRLRAPKMPQSKGLVGRLSLTGTRYGNRTQAAAAITGPPAVTAPPM